MIDQQDISKFEEESKPIDIKYYIIKYSRYWPIYIISVLMALTVAFLYHRYTVERYEVRGSILIKRNASPEVRILDRSNIFSEMNNMENDILIFTSKNLAAEALKNLHFDVSYFASTNIKEVELYDKSPIRVNVDWDHLQLENGLIQLTLVGEDEFVLSREEKSIANYFSAKANGPVDENIIEKRYTFGEVIESSNSKFSIEKVKSMRVGDKLSFVIHNPSALIDHYSDAVSVRPQNNYGSVLQVTLVSTVVEKGRDYVNALMDAYIQYDLREKNLISENTLEFIDEQMFIVEDSLRSAERRMLNFKVENKLLDLESEFGGVLGRIHVLEGHIQELEFELGYYNSLKSYLENRSEDYGEILAPSMMGISDGLLNGMTQSLITISMERRRLLSTVNENHPDVEKLNDQIERLKENIFENIKNLVANTEEKKREAELKLAEFDREFSKLPQAESSYTNIYREYKLRENLYNYLLEKRAEAGIAKASNVPDNSVVDYARKGNLIFPKKSQNYGMALGLGLFIPLGILLLYHYLNNRIMDQVQLKTAIRIPLLGTIGYSERGTNMLVAEFPKAIVSESFRSIRSALFYIASERKCKRILVTSSVSGEGKTFVSLNIASAMSLSGKKTCVIGMDLRKPRIAQYVGVSNKKGLSSYLVDKATKEEIVHQTKYENLYFVPSGPIPPNPAELLLKNKLENFINELEKEFDVIVMDTPPLALVSETMDLLRFSDVNLYIVRQDYTQKKYLLMINDLYENDQVKDFYCVFNGLKAGGDVYDFGGYNYGYGYNYSYIRKNKYTGNYYEEDAHPKSEAWLSRLISRLRG
ncbi:polysaccharide biosynthesis tyrosine autokinase [Echinicola sp. CAU 1574]|uniref:non-specific protein-tyrosine kinase n=1 Tax=Echinicola arenosa TaxID=2774144 RepID=A0ABR9AIC9_9BACT|nr:tyrosine-protein kinase [Echinicola arenosa]MBD8487608.1 polysaccharide biosynthesis tyrosine autokinase [Echinicola arenosa]